jgi:membrane protein YqaA with SNARE-associated domain
VDGFFSSIFNWFFSPGGILALSVLDSSMLFFLPAAVDTAVIVMAARHRDWFWVFPLLATIGSVTGSALTFLLGAKIGDAGLSRWVSERKLKQVRARIGENGTLAMGVAALLPPPFPLTPVVLTSGALGLSARRFFITLAAARLVRFGVEAALAILFGRQILTWIESDVFEYAISTLMIAAFAGTAVAIVQAWRQRA